MIVFYGTPFRKFATQNLRRSCCNPQSKCFGIYLFFNIIGTKFRECLSTFWVMLYKNRDKNKVSYFFNILAKIIYLQNVSK